MKKKKKQIKPTDRARRKYYDVFNSPYYSDRTWAIVYKIYCCIT